MTLLMAWNDSILSKQRNDWIVLKMIHDDEHETFDYIGAKEYFLYTILLDHRKNNTKILPSEA